MADKRYIDFFDPEVQRIAGNDGSILYKMKNSTGEGIVTQYNLFPGIDLFYNDFHMRDGENKNKLPRPNVIEINHCREGRFECVFKNGDYQYIGAGELSINRLTNETSSTLFPLSHYHGISITIDLEIASFAIKRLEEVVGDLHINLFHISERLCRKDTCFLVRDKSEIAHIFSEMYQAEPQRIAHYLKAKILELLMYLNDMSGYEYQEERRYFAKSQVQAVKQIHAFLTANLNKHYTQQELSRMFSIPLTSMKVCFKGLFGSSIYTYMKSYRMQAATILLRDTAYSVTEIASQMGYDNPSKFSEVFKKEYGELPSAFRKKMSK